MSIPWEVTGPLLKPLLLMDPHFVSGKPNALARQGEAVEIPQGARFVDTGPAPETGRHEFTFAATNRAELAFLEDFFDTRQGKAGSFWFPTWQWEFDFLGYDEPNAGSFELFVRRTGYVEGFFPLGAQFRQLAILRANGYRLLTVNSCDASVAPGVDRLWCSSANASLAPAQVFGPLATPDDSYRMLWLRWGRFDQDELVAETLNTVLGAARVDLAVVELPAEVPT